MISFSQIIHRVGNILDENFKECSLVEIKLHGNDTMVFGCFYCSPTVDNNSDSNSDRLISLIDALCRNKAYSHKKCLLGDFNFKDINWFNWSTGKSDISKESKFLYCVTENHLYQHITKPTRCRGTDEPSTILISSSTMKIWKYQISSTNHHLAQVTILSSPLTSIFMQTKFQIRQNTATIRLSTEKYDNLSRRVNGQKIFSPRINGVNTNSS